MFWLHAADVGLLVFHGALMAFNCFGMYCRATRRANLITLLLTGLSWTALGYWYGWGYCPLTDWHWQVKTQLGITGLPNSYIKWLIDTPTGWDTNAMAVDAFTLGVMLVSVLASVWLNWRDWRSISPET